MQTAGGVNWFLLTITHLPMPTTLTFFSSTAGKPVHVNAVTVVWHTDCKFQYLDHAPMAASPLRKKGTTDLSVISLAAAGLIYREKLASKTAVLKLPPRLLYCYYLIEEVYSYISWQSFELYGYQNGRISSPRITRCCLTTWSSAAALRVAAAVRPGMTSLSEVSLLNSTLSLLPASEESEAYALTCSMWNVKL